MRIGLISLIIAILAINLEALEDQSAVCRTGRSDEDCNSFGRCCARHCQGAHDSSCSEEEGRILASNCYCEENTEDGEENIGERNVAIGDLHARPGEGTLSRRPSTGSVGGSSIAGRQDSVGRGSVHGRQESVHSRQESVSSRHDSVRSRETIGGGIPGRQDSVGRGSIGSRHDSITGSRRESLAGYSTVASVNAGAGTVGDSASICRARSRTCTEFNECCNSQCRSPLRNTCTPGELFYAQCRCAGESLNLDSDRPSSPGRVPGGSSIRDRPSATGTDHTSTCKRTANNDCLEFKRCCSTKCERKYSSRCSGDQGGRLMSAYCRCTSTTTMIFGRPGTDDFPPRRESTLGGLHDSTIPRRETSGGGGFNDYTQTCRDLSAGGSCTSFRTCCDLRCRSNRDKNHSCSDRDGRIITATCTCSG